MLYRITLTILFFALALTAFAQSGRKKPDEAANPAPTPRPNSVYVLTQTDVKKPAPKPTPTQQKDEDEDDVIRVESALVPIPVSVLDQSGRAISTLKLEDFQLLIDGKTAEISDLSQTDAPVRLAMIFDNSSSVTQAREFEKKAAVRFFKRVIRPEKDLAAIYSVATASILEQPLTKNVGQLTAAIDNFPAPEGATALLDAIIKTAKYLGAVDGRRVIVIVSDGDDTISDATFEETVRVVQKMNCQVYIVKTTDFENFKRTGTRGGNANIRSLAAERRMQELALQTGGAVYSPVDEKELDAAFAQLSAELAQAYFLSYYPDNEDDRQGDFRAIGLSVKNRQNLIIRTRKGYYVPRKRAAN